MGESSKITTCPECGNMYSTAVLDKKATKDRLRSDRPDDASQKPQISADCPACGAKRILVKNPRGPKVDKTAK